MKHSSRRTKRKNFLDKHFHPKLRRSLRLYIIIALVIMVYVIFSTIKNGANPVFVVGGLILGVLVGTLLARIYKISWDSEAEKVIYRMDMLGIVFLVVFIGLDLSRGHFVSSFITGASVGPTSLALLAGGFYGRVFGAGRNIIVVLRQQKILPQRTRRSK